MKQRSKRVSSDLFLVLTSLAMAFVVWMIAKEGDLGQVTFPVRLEMTNVPANIEAEFTHNNVKRNTIQVTISAPKSLVAMLQAEHFRMELDWEGLPKPPEWPDSLKMDRTVTLKENQIITAEHLSKDLKESIHRNVLYLSLEPRKVNVQAYYVVRPASIRIRTSGEVAKDYQLASPPSLTDSQAPILLTASTKRFESLGSPAPRTPIEIPTREIDLSGRDEDFTEALSLALPSGVELAPGQVRRIEASVEIREIMTTRIIENVPMAYNPSNPDLAAEWTPSTVSVTLEGPQRILRDLVPSDLEIRPAAAPREDSENEQIVPLAGRFSPSARPGITDSTTIKTVTPSEARLRFQSRNIERAPAPD